MQLQRGKHVRNLRAKSLHRFRKNFRAANAAEEQPILKKLCHPTALEGAKT